ncbi:PREDICTED: glutathione S-transferase T3-like [Brassica oleracea var. oleracea]|uniref:glutathione S-transferase T3-like n=1 Tax=Brassica oleracea var. oleracea TaxID=109376 RepID=UPI0006A6B2BC|nr:PREDICTED: glutathione S-transferase T3-like [Brassica oleracea var. oleracea]
MIGGVHSLEQNIKDRQSRGVHSVEQNSQGTEDSNFGEDTQASRKERRTWTPTDDVVLISSWLNTSKDAVVGNEQKFLAFWKDLLRTTMLVLSLLAVKRERHLTFCGAYEATTREKSSGQNENDVLKLAHGIFFTNHKKKFTLEHAWKELRNHQKWCELSTGKNDGSSRKRKCGDISHSASSKATEADYADDDEVTNRPMGVKAAKARSKKTMVDGKELSEFQTMWSIKKQDLALKERMSKMKVLDSLIAKQGPLADYEEALKKKLIHELMSN